MGPGELGDPQGQQGRMELTSPWHPSLTQLCVLPLAICLSGCHEQNGYCSKPAECL